jgi:type II secretory ATPase GspE/PulE/Tfp pilus assembly ATPase PilB-like protein
VLDDRSKAAITNSESLINQLRSDGDKKGASNLYKQGFKNVTLGITGLEELKRVVG